MKENCYVGENVMKGAFFNGCKSSAHVSMDSCLEEVFTEKFDFVHQFRWQIIFSSSFPGKYPNWWNVVINSVMKSFRVLLLKGRQNLGTPKCQKI